MKRMQATVLFAVLSVSLGCTKNAVKAPVPGTAGTFDSDSYLTLVTTDDLIKSTKADLANNVFPASWAGGIKTALNDLIKAYDIANTAYVPYHIAALAGTATAAQQAAVDNDLNNVKVKTTALVSAKGGH